LVLVETEWSDPQDVNHSIFNGIYLGQVGPSPNNALIDVYYVNVYISGDKYQLMDYNKNCNENWLGRWYHEYKKF